MRKHNRFARGSATFVCRCCKRRTRETGPAKRYRIQAPDGKWESMNEEMFDYNVLVFLNRLTRLGGWANRFTLTRTMYRRPNGRTFDNVGASLRRSLERGDVRREGDGWQVVRRARR